MVYNHSSSRSVSACQDFDIYCGGEGIICDKSSFTWAKMKITEFGCAECGAVMKQIPGETIETLKYGCTECENIGWVDREAVEK